MSKPNDTIIWNEGGGDVIIATGVYPGKPNLTIKPDGTVLDRDGTPIGIAGVSNPLTADLDAGGKSITGAAVIAADAMFAPEVHGTALRVGSNDELIELRVHAGLPLPSYDGTAPGGVYIDDQTGNWYVFIGTPGAPPLAGAFVRLALVADVIPFANGTSLSSGMGAPTDGSQPDGSFYFRTDGGALTSIYQARSGAWVGIV